MSTVMSTVKGGRIYKGKMILKKILVIEDDRNVRTNIQELLTESGYEVQSAENGRQGLAAAKKFLPDLIICDIMMPELNGYEVLKELAEDFKTAAIPFIFLTAKAEISDIRTGMLSGADDYLIKPFTSVELLRAIEVRLSKRLLIRQNEKVKMDAHPDEEKQLDYDSNVFLLAGSNPEIIKVSRIKYILAESEYSKVITSDNKNLMVRRTLKQWEEILPREEFLRIHRSTMINLEYISKIEKWFNHSFRVHLKGVPEPFVVSRRFSSKLRSLKN